MQQVLNEMNGIIKMCPSASTWMSAESGYLLMTCYLMCPMADGDTDYSHQIFSSLSTANIIQ